jgi:hypothetical protein
MCQRKHRRQYSRWRTSYFIQIDLHFNSGRTAFVHQAWAWSW